MPFNSNIAPISSLDPIRQGDNTKQEENLLPLPSQTRLVTYDGYLASPRVETFDWSSVEELLETLPVKTYEAAKQQGGSIPFSVIKEISDNYIHADFLETVVSITDGGMTISFSDQGKGIRDKQSALLPGFTSANKKMKAYIRGVGFGLCMVSEFLREKGGTLSIKDNAARGTVVIVSLANRASIGQPLHKIEEIEASNTTEPNPTRRRRSPSQMQTRISGRESEVLALFADYDEVGPSLIHDRLGLSLGTAHRTLVSLENAGLVYTTSSRQRILTGEGMKKLYSN